MEKGLFENSIDKIYQAIRKTYGYDDEADELVDLVVEMAGISEEKIVE